MWGNYAPYHKDGYKRQLQGRYDNVEEAQDTVKKLTEDEGNGSIFDYFYKEEDYEEVTDRVKTYEDACKVLGCGLTALALPDNVTTLGDGAFSNNPNIATLQFGAGLTAIRTP